MEICANQYTGAWEECTTPACLVALNRAFVNNISKTIISKVILNDLSLKGRN